MLLVSTMQVKRSWIRGNIVRLYCICWKFHRHEDEVLSNGIICSSFLKVSAGDEATSDGCEWALRKRAFHKVCQVSHRDLRAAPAGCPLTGKDAGDSGLDRFHHPPHVKKKKLNRTMAEMHNHLLSPVFCKKRGFFRRFKVLLQISCEESPWNVWMERWKKGYWGFKEDIWC